MSSRKAIKNSDDLLKRRAAVLAVASNATLTTVKIIATIATGSVSVLAETVNSGGDLLGSIVSYYTVKAAELPPDESHTYGHGKFENLTGILIALMILCGGIFAFIEAIHRLTTHNNVIQTGPAIFVMSIAAVVNILVSNYMLRVGRLTDSPALTADGRHLQTDIVTSAAVLASLIVTRFTHSYWIDPVAALVVTGAVVWIGVQIGRDAILTLSDIALPLSEEQQLRNVLINDPNVLGFHKLRTRKAGSHRHVDVHVQIADSHTFVQAHRVTEDLEDKLRETLPNLHPIIHIEPYEDEVKHQREERQRKVEKL